MIYRGVIRNGWVAKTGKPNLIYKCNKDTEQYLRKD